MTTVRKGLVLLALACVAATQERKIEIYAENNDEGVSIRAPKSPGKDQMWEAAATESGFWKDSAVIVKHRVDKFTVDVNVQHKDPKQPMSGWLKPVEIAKQRRENFTKKEGDKEPNWKECRLITEDPKAKIALGSGHMHRLKLTDKNGNEQEITEYIILSSDTLYFITVAYTKESFTKYFAKEGQLILNSIDRAKIVKKK
jgi:hypothetical protein